MLTTLEIPDHILKHARRRAVEEGRSLRAVVTEALEAQLTAPPPPRPTRWRVPVAPRDMGWNGLSEDEILQIMARERDEILRDRAALSPAGPRHAQR